MATPFKISQRDDFFNVLFNQVFLKDKDCVIITADNGAPSLDQFTELPNQFYQVGIAEQQMIGMAAGLAHEGKKVWTYCIAPFATTRVHEFVKLDICAANLPVTILGVGAGFAYAQMGPTHHTLEDISIMRACPGLEIYSPADSVCAGALAQLSYERRTPKYIRFDRAGVPDIYKADYTYEPLKFLYTNWNKVRPDVWIVATGIMVHQALKVSTELLIEHKLEAGVVDVTRVVPFGTGSFFSGIGDPGREYGVPLISLEEHFLSGGLGSLISELLHDCGSHTRLLRLGVPDVYHFEPWGREAAWEKYELDVDSVVKRIVGWL